jgi:hypothetical protein
MSRRKPAPDLIRGGYRLAEKGMRQAGNPLDRRAEARKCALADESCGSWGGLHAREAPVEFGKKPSLAGWERPGRRIDKF